MGVRNYVSLSFDFELSTPAFIRGADRKTPEFRIPSFVGALRFWWRAVKNTQFQDHKGLREKESKIFGSSEEGQSRLHITAEFNNTRRCNCNIEGRPGIDYLSYGLQEKRKHIIEGSRGKITIYIRKHISKTLDEICAALRAMHIFGGLGSNSRDGFGSFNIISDIEIEGSDYSCGKLPRDAIELKEILREYSAEGDEQPSYSAFSKRTSVYILKEDYTDPMDILDFIGESLKDYRSWRGQQNFEDDHDLVYKITHPSNRKEEKHPKRVVFGLPHSYYLKSKKTSITYNFGNARRSSPLIFKILKVGDSYRGIAVLLESDFLPKGRKGSKITRTLKEPAKKKKGTNKFDYDKREISLNIDWDTIRNYFVNDQNWEVID